ncbi:kinase-like protein [Ophiobolus disseminans]|uniref:non-specific serine/threonine protein kinase n=1 Tax=Ophiobolus disseminans TaxID=1469910 RepID=A0A6A6ZTE1_9PLEO|nr:kinase-like protein [Ophiobolus disseminans]
MSASVGTVDPAMSQLRPITSVAEFQSAVKFLYHEQYSEFGSKCTALDYLSVRRFCKHFMAQYGDHGLFALKDGLDINALSIFDKIREEIRDPVSTDYTSIPASYFVPDLYTASGIINLKDVSSDNASLVSELESLEVESSRSDWPPSYAYQLSKIWDASASASAIRSIPSHKTSSVVFSESTFYSAYSRMGEHSKKIALGELREDDEYAQLLQSQKLWPVDPMVEHNWSGRGQHAKFAQDERPLINSLLEVHDDLGSTRTATVQSVKCRRILLARKTIACGRQTMTKEEAIKEVSHLTRLNHSHILRVIGTYVKGRHLSILLYPVADDNLEGYIEAFSDPLIEPKLRPGMEKSAAGFFGCLSHAVRYIHEKLTKHMDIKPQNILVKRKGDGDTGNFKPYIADFGIARTYDTLEAVETDGRTSFTKRYAAPEVVQQSPRGLPADIFSLGCVFLELYAAYYPEELTGSIQGALASNSAGDNSYHANIPALQELLPSDKGLLREGPPDIRPVIMKMLSHDPNDRPTAEDLVNYFGDKDCCTKGAEPLEVMVKEKSEEEEEMIKEKLESEEERM